MNNLDGKSVLNVEMFKHWKCQHGHLMGVTQRVRETLQVNGKTIRYYTTQLLLFRSAVDLANVPAVIEVAGSGNGKILSIVWRCSVCDSVREWHAEKHLVELLAATYLAE
jgi:hypothetical protein